MQLESKIKLYEQVLGVKGFQHQMEKVVEETGELLNALVKYSHSRASREDVITELADVSIMVEQMARFFGQQEFEAEVDRKLHRLKERLNGNTGKPEAPEPQRVVCLGCGMYRIPDDCKAGVRSGRVIVSKKIMPYSEPRCRSCRYFGYGKSRYNQRYDSPICLLKPKTNGNTGYPTSVQEQPRFYSTLASRKACGQYEEITPKDVESKIGKK